MDTKERTLLGALSAQPDEQALLDPGAAAEVADAFALAFGESVEAGEGFAVGGWYSAPGVRLALELADEGRERVLVLEFALELPVEADADEEERESQARAALGLLVEAAHQWLAEWLREGRWPAPLAAWQPCENTDLPIRIRGSVVNEALERLADAWLERANTESGA